MIRFFALVAAILLTGVSSGVGFCDEHKYLKAFPPAPDAMHRFVINLPHKERGEDERFKVEILAGKMVETDGVNHVHLGAKIQPKPLKGWGFTYYEVPEFGPTASTLVAVPPGTDPKQEFVSTSLIIPYNSRVPVVVYVPTDGEVRYRIWEASNEVLKGEKG